MDKFKKQQQENTYYTRCDKLHTQRTDVCQRICCVHQAFGSRTKFCM